MSHLLWLHFLENDLPAFQHTLALAAQPNPHHPRSKPQPPHGTSPGSILSTSPTVTRGKRGAERSGKGKNVETLEISRGDINWKDLQGRTLLHLIASSTAENASEFAEALLQLPVLDLYEQDEENGWTALHRAFYTGNVTIARTLIARDTADVGTVAGLIKIKDREGNSPFDVHGSTMGMQPAPRSDMSMQETEDVEGYLGSDDSGSEEDPQFLPPRRLVNGDEVYAFGSNKNFTLGFSDEDDRQFPERIHFHRPDTLMYRYFEEYKERERKAGRACDDKKQPFGIFELPACVRYRRMQIQDVQLAKLSSAVLTNDVEANLYMCGFGSGGRLGTGDETTRFNYVNIRGGGLSGKKVMAIALGQNHTIAISSQGETFTWGSSAFGQLGYAAAATVKDEEPAQLLPKHVFGPLKREEAVGAAASRIHSAVYTSSSLYTFGKNEGQMGLVDADARSLTSQTTPRKVGASLITSPIRSVSAIDKATICLLQNHEVLVFANYGYTKVNFHVDSAAKFLQDLGQSTDRFGQGRPVTRGNEITKIAAAGDTICAMTAMGDVSTVQVSRHLEPSSTPSSTTNPSKIKGALSTPQLIWSLKKAHMAVRDVEVGQDGSIIICTQSGSVWRRIKRAKLHDGKTSHKAKDYKFSRVPGLTRIAAVRSNAFGGFAAIRRNTDMLRTWPQSAEPRLRPDVQPLSPFSGFCVDDSDAENPLPRYWVSKQIPEVAKLRRAIMSSDRLDNLRLEEDVGNFIRDHVDRDARGFDLCVCTTSSKVHIPVHSFMFAGRSTVIDKALSEFRTNYYYTVPEVVDIEYDNDGRPLLRFNGIDFISLINLVLYIYTDTIINVWQFPRQSREQSTHYRHIRNEMMKVAAALDMRKLEHAVRLMNQTPRTMDDDFERAIASPTFFENADMEIELDGASQMMHSAFACRRCPFIEGMFQGRAQGRWVTARMEDGEESEPVKVDMTHVEPQVFSFVLRHIYADTDESMFDGVVTADLDTYLDLIIDVMSVANELMLDRLSRCCQLVLTRYVTTRNVCQLLNAVAPCSVTDFKTAALNYICFNLECMLENHLLSDLDDDLMLELDGVVKQNQLAAMPFVKSGRKEADLLERHPALVGHAAREKQVKIDRVLLQSKLREKERAQLRPTNDLLEDFETPSSKKGQRRSSDARSPPMLGKQKSSHDLMFELEGHEERKSPDTRRRRSSNDQVQRQLDALELPEAAVPSSFEPDTPGQSIDNKRRSAAATKPWAGTSLTPSKFDMKEIMAQTSSSQSSNLSSALAKQQQTTSPIPASRTGGPPAKLSQKDRKRLQQQQLEQAKSSSAEPDSPNLRPQSATPAAEKPAPWQRVTSNPRVSMKDVLAGSSPVASPSTTPSSSKASKPGRSGSPMTLRQTVAGGTKPAPARRTVSEPIQTSTAPSPSIARPAPSPHKSSSKSRSQALSPPRSLSTSTYTPAVSIPSTSDSGIKSIRHTPAPAREAAGSSWSTSMDDILAQQIGEKEALKDALAKRSLSEIQEEQAFEVWWDRESRRVQGVDGEGEEEEGVEKKKKAGEGKAKEGSRRRVRASRGAGAGESKRRDVEGRDGRAVHGNSGEGKKREGPTKKGSTGQSGKKDSKV